MADSMTPEENVRAAVEGARECLTRATNLLNEVDGNRPLDEVAMRAQAAAGYALTGLLGMVVALTEEEIDGRVSVTDADPGPIGVEKV